ncbi:MAG TPA: DUF4389 domain-containing protein [Woeseiaceae bacterium]|nr:DUF4389 domain-containing protein [Woeseiaceae bacterium]
MEERPGDNVPGDERPRDHVPDEPRDHVPEEDLASTREPSEFEEHIKSKTTWLRLLFMIIFVFLYGLSRFVVLAVVVLQFFWVLFTGETNEKLKTFGQSLATYTYQLIRYLTYNSDSRPFPFDDDWPSTVAPPL